MASARVRLLLILFMILIAYVLGSFSKGTPNLPIYEEWANDISKGLLLELYHIKDGQSMSASLGDLIVPYPPITLFVFWIFSQLTKIFITGGFVSWGFIVNLSAVTATFFTAAVLSISGKIFGSRTYLYFLASPVVFLLSPILGYQDALMTLFLVLGLHCLTRDRYALVGVFFGLALMSKQLSLMPIAAVIFVFLLQQKFLAFAKICGALLVTILVVLSPFIMTRNLIAYLESQALASVHTMLAAQTANFPYVITFIHRSIQEGFWEGLFIGGNGLRILDDQLRQLTYFGFALIAGIVFLIWVVYFRRRFGLRAMNYWHVASMMIFTYYLFCAGVHENHIFMALPLLLCLPASRQVKRIFLAFSIALFLHLLISWGIGASFPVVTSNLSNSGSANTVGTLVAFLLYLYAFVQLWKLPPALGSLMSAHNFDSRERE
jgi:uncharacterized membrane protein